MLPTSWFFKTRVKSYLAYLINAPQLLRGFFRGVSEIE